MRFLQTVQGFDLDRRVAHHLQQLPVAPNIGFERRDIEIANQERRPIELSRPLCHALEKIEFLTELGVLVAIGNIAACGDVDIFEMKPGIEPDANMPGFAIGLPVAPVSFVQRHFADDRHAMVHLLAVQRLMLITERCERMGGERFIDRLRFLQAQYVRRFFGEETLDDADAETDRIDVPGRDFEGG